MKMPAEFVLGENRAKSAEIAREAQRRDNHDQHRQREQHQQIEKRRPADQPLVQSHLSSIGAHHAFLGRQARSDSRKREKNALSTIALLVPGTGHDRFSVAAPDTVPLRLCNSAFWVSSSLRIWLCSSTLWSCRPQR